MKVGQSIRYIYREVDLSSYLCAHPSECELQVITLANRKCQKMHWGSLA